MYSPSDFTIKATKSHTYNWWEIYQDLGCLANLNSYSQFGFPSIQLDKISKEIHTFHYFWKSLIHREKFLGSHQNFCSLFNWIQSKVANKTLGMANRRYVLGEMREVEVPTYSILCPSSRIIQGGESFVLNNSITYLSTGLTHVN